jgi:long-chain acyl-CoA synthetase
MIEQNLVKDFFQASLIKFWDLPSLTDIDKKTYHYKDIAKKIVRLHIMFEECELKNGDKVALLAKNTTDWAVIYLATITYGAVIVPILPDFHPNEIHHIINHSESVVLFVSKQLWNKIDESKMPNLKAIISLDDNTVLNENNKIKVTKKLAKLDELFSKKYGNELQPEQIKFQNIPNSKLAALNYTSGSTGFSKGVMLTANNIAANIDFGQRYVSLNPGDKMVSILPLAHTFGCSFDFLTPFTRGVHIHFLTRMPTPKILLDAYKKIRPNMILLVPLILEKVYKKQILAQISKEPIKSLLKIPGAKALIYKKINKSLSEAFGANFREIIIGGAPLNKEVADFLTKINFRYTVGYGMTECGPIISYANWDKTKPNSCGQVVDTLKVNIDSENPHKDVGEILVKGEMVMKGYYKNPEATKKAIDNEGWLHTGDLGIIDKENFIFIKGRSKSMILGPSGENIYPEEIEAIINNKEFVGESLVINRNNNLIALIYPDYELMDKTNTTIEQMNTIIEKIRLEVNKDLPKYKQIAKVELFPNEFEKTPKQNIKRYLYQN